MLFIHFSYVFHIFFICFSYIIHTFFIRFSYIIHTFFCIAGIPITQICNHFNWQYSISIKEAYREQDDKQQIYLSDLMDSAKDLFWNPKTLKFIVYPILMDHVKPEMLNWSKLYFRKPHYAYCGDATFGWCNQLISSKNSY